MTKKTSDYGGCEMFQSDNIVKGIIFSMIRILILLIFAITVALLSYGAFYNG